MKTHSLNWNNSQRETEPNKKGTILPWDNNSPNRTDYPREAEPNEKKRKVLPSDNNSPNKTDYPRETEPGEKKGKVLPSDNNSSHTNDKTGKKIKKWRFLPHGDKSDYTRNNKRTRVSSGFYFRNCEIVQYD